MYIYHVSIKHLFMMHRSVFEAVELDKDAESLIS